MSGPLGCQTRRALRVGKVAFRKGGTDIRRQHPSSSILRLARKLWAETYNRDLEGIGLSLLRKTTSPRTSSQTVADSYGVTRSFNEGRNCDRRTTSISHQWSGNSNISPTASRLLYASAHTATQEPAETRGGAGTTGSRTCGGCLAGNLCRRIRVWFPCRRKPLSSGRWTAARHAIEIDRSNQFRARLRWLRYIFFRQDLSRHFFFLAAERRADDSNNPLNSDALGILGLQIGPHRRVRTRQPRIGAPARWN